MSDCCVRVNGQHNFYCPQHPAALGLTWERTYSCGCRHHFSGNALVGVTDQCAGHAKVRAASVPAVPVDPTKENDHG